MPHRARCRRDDIAVQRLFVQPLDPRQFERASSRVLQFVAIRGSTGPQLIKNFGAV